MATIADGVGAAAERRAKASVKTLLFYDHPVALNRQTHRDLRLDAAPGVFDFARSTNSVPIAAVEFAESCRHYPIVFAGNTPEGAVPAVLLGLRADENLFVDADARWSSGYVPAFVRRYPFVLAEKTESDDFTVCIDEGYPGLNTQQGESLFDDDGVEGPFLSRALRFLGEFQGQMKRTHAFASRLNELGLLQPKVVQGGKEKKNLLQGFFVVDEQALKVLDDATIRELLESGELGWIYMHLISLGNIGALSARHDESGVVI